jgi:hypothetical protein
MKKNIWKENLEIYDRLVEMNPNFERKGKTMPYTSANGHMFSLLNKDGELGIRLSKEDGEKFMEKYETTRFKSHGAFMRGYVLVPQNLLEDLETLSSYLDDAYNYVLSLEPK